MNVGRALMWALIGFYMFRPRPEWTVGEADPIGEGWVVDVRPAQTPAGVYADQFAQGSAGWRS